MKACDERQLLIVAITESTMLKALKMDHCLARETGARLHSISKSCSSWAWLDNYR